MQKQQIDLSGFQRWAKRKALLADSTIEVLYTTITALSAEYDLSTITVDEFREKLWFHPNLRRPWRIYALRKWIAFRDDR